MRTCICTTQDLPHSKTLGVINDSAPSLIASGHCKSLVLMTDKCRLPLLRVTKRSAMSISASHHADKANMGIMRDEEGSYIAYALRPIKKGEEVSCPFHNILL